jgi:predicted dehydrogenase
LLRSHSVHAPRVIAFVDPHQLPLLRAVARDAGVTIVGAGSPTKGQTGTVAARLACQPVDDLRSALTEGDCDAVLIVSPGDFGAASASAATDARAVLAAFARGVGVASFEPLPCSALDVRGAWGESQSGTVAATLPRFVGLPKRLRAFRDAAEILSQFGTPRLVHAEALGTPEQGSLGARLLAACDLVVGLMGEPETVDAAYVPPAQGLRAAPGDRVTSLQGDLCATLRFADGRAASILASTRGSRWNCGCTILGDMGRLRIHDRGFSWFAADGTPRDELRYPSPYASPDSPGYSTQSAGSASSSSRAESSRLPNLFTALDDTSSDAASRTDDDLAPLPPAHDPAVIALAESLARILDPNIPDEGPIEAASVLAVMQAAMLSARTGQPERPQTFRTVNVGGL